MPRTIALCAAVLAAALGTAVAQQAAAPQETIKRTPLQKSDVPDSKYEAVLGMAEIVPDGVVGRHTHPGIETAYVLDGEITLTIEGQPPMTLKAGDSYKVPPSAVHGAKSGAKGAKILVTYVVEKGKPLATPAPQ